MVMKIKLMVMNMILMVMKIKLMVMNMIFNGDENQINGDENAFSW